ncbi:MAG: DUF2341 domain-containing protein, partial [Thermoplasmata archaeon]|nr:DUF2341 domain-containing protein [Thermoplasmata archaeon]
IDGWEITDEDEPIYAIPDIPDFPSHNYVVIHYTTGTDETSFGQSQSNALHLYTGSSGVYTDIDQCSVYTGSTHDGTTIVDFVAWGADPESNDCYAVAAGIWDDGDFFDSSDVDEGETMGRDKDSTDTDQPGDWDDHGGKDATGETPGAQNIGEEESGHLVINEVKYDPCDPDNTNEWVEIYNPTSSTVNLDGYYISNRDITHNIALPNWDMPADSYLIIHLGEGTNDPDFTDDDGDGYMEAYYYVDLPADFFDNDMDEVALYRLDSSGISITEDFESGGWSGGTGWSDDWYHVVGETDTEVTGDDPGDPWDLPPHGGDYHLETSDGSTWVKREFSLASATDATLTLWWMASDFEGPEHAYIKVSSDNSIWTTILTASYGDDDQVYHYLSYDLSSFVGDSSVWLGIQADMDTGSDRFFIDDIEIIREIVEMVDFIAYNNGPSGYVPGDAHDEAVAAGIWDDGDFFDSSDVDEGETMGRDKDSTDTDQPGDWDDHGGRDATRETPGARNIPITPCDELYYSTFLGGSGDDGGKAITVDSNGNAYVTGYTSSSNFPTTSGAYDTTYNCGYDAFVSKLNSAGNSLLYSTFIGGSGYDEGRGIAVDTNGNVYVTGHTFSSNFPTVNAYDSSLSGDRDAFVVKLNAEQGYIIGWWNSNWLYRKKITIDHTNVDSTLTDFPVLVKIDSTSDLDFSKVEGSSGQDIRFTSTGTPPSEYKYEIERWDNSNNLAEIWVKIPSVSSGTDTEFYMYYGNSGASDGQDAANVWDTNYVAVWHLGEDPTGTIYDSTSNNNDGTTYGSMTSSDLIDTKIGKGLDLDGTDDYIQWPLNNGLDITGNQITLSGWARTPSGGVDNDEALINKVGSGYPYMLGMQDSTGAQDLHNFRVYNGNKQVRIQPASVPVNEWVYLAGRYDGSNCYAYVNGLQVGTDTLTGNIVTGTAVYSGRRSDTRRYEGDMDELRVSNIARSAEWIKASYYSESNNLLTYSSQQMYKIGGLGAMGYSTYLGGGSYDYGEAIAVDSNGNAYITGYTWSFDFPTVNAYDSSYNDNADAFVSKLDPSQSGTSSLLYSTFLGGSGDDGGYGIAVGSSGNAYVTGYTSSTDFPTTSGAYDTSHNGNEDVFVSKL